MLIFPKGFFKNTDLSLFKSLGLIMLGDPMLFLCNPYYSFLVCLAFLLIVNFFFNFQCFSVSTFYKTPNTFACLLIEHKRQSNEPVNTYFHFTEKVVMQVELTVTLLTLKCCCAFYVQLQRPTSQNLNDSKSVNLLLSLLLNIP